MKKIILACAFVIVCTPAALARGDIMASRYGNTIVSTDSAGVVSQFLYKANHTFAGMRGGMPLKGTWKVDNGQLCQKFDAPPTMGNGALTNPYCAPVQEHKVGDIWTVGQGANMLTFKITKSP